MDKRVIMRVELSPAARETFTNVPTIFGMTQVAVTSRLLTWMTEQSEEVQARILGLYPVKSGESVATTVLKDMVTKEKRERSGG
jgi:hypothetical protein